MSGARELKSWEKPNVFMIRGKGPVMYYPFDESGKVVQDGMKKIKASGWTQEIGPTAIALAHVVEGEENSLVQHMATYTTGICGKPMTTLEMAIRGHLFELVEGLRKKYIEAVEKRVAGELPIERKEPDMEFGPADGDRSPALDLDGRPL